MAIGVAAVGGIILRFWGPSPLWLDEALSVSIADLPFAEMVEALRRDGHPILYYLLLGWWMDIFGDSDLAIRSMSGVASLLAVPAVWALGKRIDRDARRVALILALSSPFLLRFGTEARMYALLTLLVALGWLAVTRALESPTPWRLGAVALSAAALVHTHYWSLWLIAAAGLVLSRRATRRDNHATADRRVLLAIIAGASTLVVWFGVLYDQARSTGTPWAGRARPAEVVIEAMQAIGGSHRYEGQTLGLIFVVVALVGTFATVSMSDHVTFAKPTNHLAAGAALMVPLTLAIGAAAALASGGAFEPRYTAVVVPFVLILVARGIIWLPPRVGAALLVVAVTGGLAVGADEARRDRTQARDVATVIDTAAQPGDTVIFCPDQVGPSSLRELESDLTTIAYPSGTGLFVDWTDYLERIGSVDPVSFADRIDRAAPTSSIWLVWGQNYRGFDGRCEAIIDTLAARRRTSSLISPSTAFEALALLRFEAQQ